MNSTYARGSALAVLTALLSACASTPAPMAKLLVATISRVGELQKLSQQPAVVVNLKTVGAQEKWLILERSDQDAFVGHAFAGLTALQGMSDAPLESVPFNEVALVYYATPPHPFLSEVAPEHASFPSLPAPGLVEQGASCADLDVELARAEAIRWYARDSGAMALTSGEAAGKHFRNFAKDTGIAVLVFLAMSAGGGGPCPGCSGPSAVLSPEDWRWTVTAAQHRTIGLLELKQSKHCAARVMADTSVSDREVLEGIRSVQHEGSAGHLDDKAQVAQETVWLDKLNPAPLAPTELSVGIPQNAGDMPATFTQAMWVPNKVSLSALGSKPWQGAIVLTETSLILKKLPEKRESVEQELRIPYADMVSIEIRTVMRARWIVMTRTDGHMDSFWFVHGATIDRETTEAVGELLKAKVPGKSADGAGK